MAPGRTVSTTSIEMGDQHPTISEANISRPTTLELNTLGRDIEETRIEDASRTSTNNKFSLRKNFVHGLFDVALLMANVSQLRAVLDSEGNNEYYRALLILIGSSIAMQVLFAMIMLMIWRIERRLESNHHRPAPIPSSTPQSSRCGPSCPCERAETWDDISVFVMLVIIVLNVFVTGLGLTEEGTPPGGSRSMSLFNTTRM